MQLRFLVLLVPGSTGSTAGCSDSALKRQARQEVSFAHLLGDAGEAVYATRGWQGAQRVQPHDLAIAGSSPQLQASSTSSSSSQFAATTSTRLNK